MITTRGRWALGLGLLLLASGCQGSEEADGSGGQPGAGASGQPSAGASGQAGGGQAGQGAGGSGQAGGAGSGGAGASGQAGGGLTSVPFEPAGWDPAACDLPLRVARAGEEVGALYERDGSLWLQRLSSSGQPLGEAAALGSVGTPYGQAHASLASDGQRYVACWDTVSTPPGQAQAFRVTCVSVPAAGGAPTTLLSEVGSGPTVAAGSHGVAVAYRPSSGAIVVRYLDPGSGVAPRELALDTPESPFQSAPRALLVATAGGFAVVTPAATHFHRLDHALAVTSGPLRLDPSKDIDWSGRPLIVALGDAVAISVRLPYGNDLYVVDAHDQVSRAVHYEGGGKLGTDVALVAEEATFDTFWVRYHDGVTRLMHESFAPAAPPVHKPEPLDADPWATASSHPACALAVAALPGGASLVVTPTASGVAGQRLE